MGPFRSILKNRSKPPASPLIQGSRYPGVPATRPPKACASSVAMSRAIHETDMIRIVTSSNDANTGPMPGSDMAAALMDRL